MNEDFREHYEDNVVDVEKEIEADKEEETKEANAE